MEKTEASFTNPSSSKHHNTEVSTPLITISNAGIGKGDAWWVRNIDLTINRGEIITLIGPNGSGKTTTAKLIAGILKPTEGNIKRQKKLKIGYVPQKLYFDKSLPLNVQRLMTLTGPLSSEEITDVLEQVGMAHKLKDEVTNLSGGELQRVLLARAIARKPDLLILDEPLQGVDFSWESTLYQWISTYRTKLNCGVLLISHDLHIVMAASDHVLCLNGHICCSGKPEEVAASNEYLSLFGHKDEQNNTSSQLAFYAHKHNHKHD